MKTIFSILTLSLLFCTNLRAQFLVLNDTSEFEVAPVQLFNLQHDHSTIIVSDLDKSAKFYKNILQLKELDTPWGVNPNVRFFSTGKNQQLHLAKVARKNLEQNKVIHLAFAVENFDSYLSYLTENKIEFWNFSGKSKKPQISPDGVRQIYFQDPDGNWIEINDAKY